MKKLALIVAALAYLGTGRLDAAPPRQERLAWDELDSRLAGQKVALVLPGGTEIQGRVQRVVAEGLWMVITKTSDRRVQPKGAHLIARPSVSVLRLTQNRKIGRLLGVAGAVALAGGIVAAQNIDIYEGPALVIVPVAIAGAMGGAAVGGYYVGKAFDKRVIEITVVPEGK